MVVSDEIAAYLAASAHGTVGTNIFADAEPDEPAALVSVNAYSGPKSIHTFGKGTRPIVRKVKFQVVVRGAMDDRDGAWTKAVAIRDLLEVVTEETLGGARYLHIEVVMEPEALSPSEQDEPRVAASYLAWREA